MSGGSLNYVSEKLNDAVEEIRRRGSRPLHAAFASKLSDMALALHKLEWAWSGDIAQEDADLCIETMLGPDAELREDLRATRRCMVLFEIHLKMLEASRGVR